MPTIFTEGRKPGEFLISEEDDGKISRETVTIASGSGIIAPGSVLGKITASGKYCLSPATGSDGSETAVAVALYGVDATSADKPLVVVHRLAEVNGNALTYHASVSDDAKKTAKQVQLAANMIITR